MNKFIKPILASLLIGVAAPAYADEVWHAFSCQLLDDTTEDEVIDFVETWLDAVNDTEGGEEIGASVHFPIAAQMGESDFRIIMKAPNLAVWGQVWTTYDDSEAQKMEEASNDRFDCTDSALWESVTID